MRRITEYGIRVGLAAHLICSLTGNLVAVQQQPVVTLQQALTAVKSSPLVLSADAEQKKADARYKYALGLRYLSKIELTVASGVIPESDDTYVKGLGPFVKNELKIVQPLYTFGKLDAARDAADYGRKAQQTKGLITGEKVMLETIRAWWAVTATRDAADTVTEMMDKYAKLEKDVAKEAKKLNSSVSDNDILELKVKKYSLVQMQQEAVVRRKLAEEAFLLMTGPALRPGQTNSAFELSALADPEIAYTASNTRPFILYAVGHRNEIRGLKLAAAARRSLVLLEKRRSYPDLFIAAGVRLNWAHTELYDDSFNSKGAAAFIGLKWDLDFWRTAAKRKQAEADVQIEVQKLQGFLMKMRLDVVKAVQQAAAAGLILEQGRKSLKAAKSWLRLAGDNWEMGLGKVDEVVKAYRAYFEMQAGVIKARYEYHLALANLAHQLGDTKLYLRWVQNEKVQLP